MCNQLTTRLVHCKEQHEVDDTHEDSEEQEIRVAVQSAEDLYLIGDGTMRTTAHAVAILLRARDFIPRELEVDGSAMRAIAAVLMEQQTTPAMREEVDIASRAALAARFATTPQQISKYDGLLQTAGYSSVEASMCSHFCSCFGWSHVAGPGLCSGCPCPRCAVTHRPDCGVCGNVLWRGAARV